MLSDSDASDLELGESEQLQIVLELHYNRRKRWKKRLKRDPGYVDETLSYSIGVRLFVFTFAFPLVVLAYEEIMHVWVLLIFLCVGGLVRIIERGMDRMSGGGES